MSTREQAKIRFIAKTIDALENAAARENVDADDDPSQPFVYDTRNKNFVRNMGTLSLIPANRRVNVGAEPDGGPWNTTWLPYDVRTIRGIFESGRTPTIPHVPNAIIPGNVRRIVQPNLPAAQTPTMPNWGPIVRRRPGQRRRGPPSRLERHDQRVRNRRALLGLDP